MSFVVELPLDQYHRDAFAAFTPDVGFHIGTARATAWLSRLAYESDPGKIDTMLAAWGLSREASFASPARGLLPMASTRGLVTSGRGATLVVFSGTDALRLANWITDFNARLSPAGLHRGFEAAVDTVWPRLLDIIGRSGKCPLFFAGHSLGAALAVLAAERAAAEGHLARGVYAFGMPRVGGAEFAARYPLADTTYRLVHGEDIVPSVPPSKLGFRHVGCLLRAPRGGVFDGAPLPAGGDDPPFAASLVAGLKAALPEIGRGWPQPPVRPGPVGQYARFLPPRYGDHLPDRYCRAFNRPA
jgi:Lipase (class 3)